MKRYWNDWENPDALDEVPFSDLYGQTLVAIVYDDKNYIEFITDQNKKYVQFHTQNCCETVYINDICGDLDDLLNTPILLAEKVTSSEDWPEGVPGKPDEDDYDTFTWTFYKLATIKGYVTIRWLGTSNGYYSESVEFYRVNDEQQ